MSLGYGLIGTGMIAPVHLRAIEGLSGAELRGVMDQGSGLGLRLAPGLSTEGSDDLEAFLAREDLDVIAVASPTGSHGEIAIKAAQAGKHCLVEKPLETTAKRIDAMIAAHQKAGTFLGCVFNSRYSEAALKIKQAVEQGRFGKLTFASAQGPWWREQSYYDSAQWRGTWALDGGGALMNQGIHSIDLLQWFVGARVQSISGRIATLAHEAIEVEDTGAACLVFENGTLATIACTTSMWPGHFRTITLAGTTGTAVLADENLLFWKFREETHEDEAIRSRLLALPSGGVAAGDPSQVQAEGHSHVYAAFTEALLQGRPPPVDGAEGRKAVRIIQGIYESSNQGGLPVTLD